MNTSAFYRQQGAIQLPLTSIVEIYKAGKVMTVMMLRESRDEVIHSDPPNIRTARKWKAEDATDEIISSLNHRDIVGAVQGANLKERAGCKPFKPFSTMTQKER